MLPTRRWRHQRTDKGGNAFGRRRDRHSSRASAGPKLTLLPALRHIQGADHSLRPGLANQLAGKDIRANTDRRVPIRPDGSVTLVRIFTGSRVFRPTPDEASKHQSNSLAAFCTNARLLICVVDAIQASSLRRS
jgi:hypothetical protein